RRWSGKEVHHASVMVSGKGDDPRLGCRCLAQKFEDLPRLRPTIHVIAEIDDPPVARLIPLDLFKDALMHFGEQIETTMYVANRIDAHAGRCGGISKRYAPLTHHRQRSHAGHAAHARRE